jgi:hypothetical protein
MYEAYLVACGTATLVVEHRISAGMIVVVEPVAGDKRPG